MDTDDLEPRNRPIAPVDLEGMSIQALQDRIEGLEAEIERCRAVIARKEAARRSADAFFKR